jgi:hypothetical protein
MATLTVTNTFANGVTSDAPDVNTNFQDIVTFVNASVIHADGANAFTADQSMGSKRLTTLATPTADTDAVTKAYVDALMGFDYVRWRTTKTGGIGTITDVYQGFHTDTFAMFPLWTTMDVAVFAFASWTNLTAASAVQLQIRVDGADQADDTTGQVAASTTATGLTMAEVETSEASIDVSLRMRMLNAGATATVKYVRMWVVGQRKA